MGVTMLGSVLVNGTGCDPSGPAVRQDAARLTEIQRLQDENERLKVELAQKGDQLADLAGTIASLRGLEGERSIDKIVHVDRIDIDRLSGGYDSNRDGIDDGVAVYLVPFDQFGGVLRASGSATVTLLDLTDPAKPATVGELSLGVEEMEKSWYGAFLTSQYTLKIPWAAESGKPPAGQITVVVSFNDLLTGRTFTAQRVVSVTGAGGLPSPG